MKIQIIGYSGSGKSTLAKTLAKMYNIPVLYLDNVKFYGDWQAKSDEEQIEAVQKFLDENESWVIDGNYSKICPQRFEMSDMTIFMNFNRFKCFFAARKRAKQYKDYHRESCACNDKFDREFKKWLLIDGRTKERRKKHVANLNKTKGRKVVLKNRRQVNKFISSIQNELKQNGK